MSSPEEVGARAMAALETMAQVWSAGFEVKGHGLRQIVRALMTQPDGEQRLMNLLVQAHMEGLYAGRTSPRDPSADDITAARMYHEAVRLQLLGPSTQASLKELVERFPR